MPKVCWMPLPSLSAVAVAGREARAFLQGQLTGDLLALDRHPGMLAAACSVQGRVLATLRLAARGDTVLMVLPRAMAPLLVAHLSRFVLRAEVAFSDPGYAVFGLLDGAPSLQAEIAAAGHSVLLAGPARALVVGEAASSAAALATLPPGTTGDWEYAGILDGEPAIHPETSGLWVPQMLNLDLLSAISFAKGCYLGQEIVARAQHLGRIKRRMLRYQAAAGAVPVPGSMLYAGAAPAAQVVRACEHAGLHCLAVVELADCGELLGANPQGSEWVPAALPYAIPAPDAVVEEPAAPAG